MAAQTVTAQSANEKVKEVFTCKENIEVVLKFASMGEWVSELHVDACGTRKLWSSYS